MKKIVLSENQAKTLVEQLIGTPQPNLFGDVLGKRVSSSDAFKNQKKSDISTGVNEMGSFKMPESFVPYRDSLLKKLYSKVPYYIYYVLRFILLKYEPVTNAEVPPDVINTLSDILCEKSKRMGTCDPNMWTGNDLRGNNNKNYFGYSDATSMYSKSPTYNSKTVNLNSQPTNIRNVSWVLGQAKITQSGNNWHIEDMYNFDNVMEKHEFFKSENYLSVGLNFVTGFLRAIFGFFKIGSMSGGVEEILTQYHRLGYPGYKSLWDVPIGNCDCGSKPTTEKPNIFIHGKHP